MKNLHGLGGGGSGRSEAVNGGKMRAKLGRHREECVNSGGNKKMLEFPEHGLGR